MSAWHRSVVRFLTVGLSNTLIGVAVIVIARKVLGLPDLASNAAGYAVGFLWSFALNRSWTFGFRGTAGVTVARYAIVCAAGYLVNVAVLLKLRSVLPTLQILPQILAIGSYTVATYLGCRYYVFTGKAGRQAVANRKTGESQQ